jgi:hypothetical protein
MKFVHFIIQKYLPFSIRLIAYTANFYFSEIINPFFLILFRNFPYSKLLLFILGIIFYEVADRIINTYYRPKFVRKGRNEIKKEKMGNFLVLDDNSYEYRTRTEKLILVLAFYYGVNLILSLYIYCISSFSRNTLNLIVGGVGGAVISFCNFLGLALLISKIETRTKGGRVFLKIIGLGLTLGPALYVSYALLALFFY